MKTYTIKPGDYVRINAPGRQRLVPCKVLDIDSECIHCEPLARCHVHTYTVPLHYVHSIINPKHVKNND